MPNFILQELPEGMHGKKVLYPKMQTYTMQEYDQVLNLMHDYAGSFSEGTMRAVFDALLMVMKTWMPMGHTIKIDGLGVFSLSLGFDTNTPSEKALAHGSKESADKAEYPKTKYRHVCIKGINFKPDPQLLADMNRGTSFDKVESAVKVPQKSRYSREQRIEIAKAIIDQNGYMTLTDYVIATGLSRSGASVDLKNLVADPTSGITSRGSHSHKVWVMG